MSKEQKEIIYDGQNRCRRCDRPLKDPTANYGWWCAKLVGFDNYQKVASVLDEDQLKGYNAYVSTYLIEDDKTVVDNSGKFERVAWMDSVKEGAEWVGEKLYDVWNWGEDNIWKGIATGMKAVGYELTADLLSLAASGSGNIYEKTSGSYASNLLKNDIAYYDTKWGLLDSVDVKIKFSDFY